MLSGLSAAGALWDLLPDDLDLLDPGLGVLIGLEGE
jgi:hypothetical protein